MKPEWLRATRHNRREGWCSYVLVVFVAFALIGCSGGGGATATSSSAPAPAGDTVSPSVSITGPTSSAIYTAPGATLNLSGTGSDDVGVTQVTWSNNLGGSGTATGTSSWSVTGISLQTGTNRLTVTARDAAGNTGTAILDVTYGGAKTYYLSPAGNNANSGLLTSAPWKTFAKAFSVMVAGDELILLDGTYSAAAGTGVIHWDITAYGANSAQPPSGASLTAMTYIHALNPGQVVINGVLFIGRSFRKDSFIKIQGITFEGGGQLYNADYTTIKDSGIHGGFSIGTNDHNFYNDHNLIEDVWIWASGERIVAINYRSHFNVWRRVVVRGDGCGTAGCTGSGNPNVGITIYDSNNISFQNIIVVDRILASGDEPYGDFASAQHTADPQFYFGQNEWLGTISVKAPDTGYIIEPDAGQIVDPTVKISNAVAWDSAVGGFNIARDGTNNLLENLTANTNSSSGIRIAPEMTTGTLRNAIVTGTGSFGINSKYTPSYVDTFGTFGSTFNQTTCSTGCFTSNPKADGATPSLKYLTRIETGSLLKGAGFGGTDIGANVLFRYGVDGTRFGEANYNTLTATSLWPWPNEARIKSQMCASTTRGFCSSAAPLGSGGNIPAVKTLTTYIWEYLGNAIPAGIYP